MNKPESSEMVLVPREPTHEMMIAVDDAYGDGGDFADMWEAAIAAAPTRPTAADFEAWLRTVCFQKPTPEAYDLAKCAWRDSGLAAHPSNQVQEPVAWLWQYVGSDPMKAHIHPCARSLHEMDPKNPPYPERWKPVAPLYASPQAVPSEQPIAEQPQSDKANLTVAVGTDLPPALSEDAPPRTLQARDQCRAVIHMAKALAEVHEARALILAHDPRLTEVIGSSTAYLMEMLGDALSNMDAVDEADDNWFEAVFEAAHAMWPTEQPGESAGAQPSHKKYLPSMPPPAASLPASAPAGQEDARARATDWGLTKGVAMSLKPFLRPGEKVIWREPFRWKDENGVLSNHYESMSLAALAEDFNYEIVEDFKHAAIIRPLAAMSATTKENP